MIDDVVYPIETDFRAGIKYATELMRGKLTPRRLLSIWFPVKYPEDISAAQDAVNTFYLCGREPEGDPTFKGPAYAYEADAEEIIAAFQREYNIDLTSASMHWWRFYSLLRGLIAHSFSDKVRYRVTNPSDIKSDDIRKDYVKYRRMYALDEHGDPIREPETLDDYNRMILKLAHGER